MKYFTAKNSVIYPASALHLVRQPFVFIVSLCYNVGTSGKASLLKQTQGGLKMKTRTFVSILIRDFAADHPWKLCYWKNDNLRTVIQLFDNREGTIG